MAVDYGLTVDKEGFNASMEEARQKARNARNKVMQKLIMKVIIKTLFVFYFAQAGAMCTGLPLITGALAQL
jgi:alanyl-tRNA synthetase